MLERACRVLKLFPFGLLLFASTSFAPAFAESATPASDSVLGILARDLPFASLAAKRLDYGVEVVSVIPDSPAQRAGLTAGDILWELDAKPIYSVARLRWLVSQVPPRSNVAITYHRNGHTRTTRLALEAPVAPPETGTPWWARATYLGVQLQPMTDELREVFGAPAGAGMLVVRLMADSPAARAELRVGDVLLRMDRKIIRNMGDVYRVLAFFDPGDAIEVEVIRDRQRRVVEVVLVASREPHLWPGGLPPFPMPEDVPPTVLDPRPWRDFLEQIRDKWEELWERLDEDKRHEVPRPL